MNNIPILLLIAATEAAKYANAEQAVERRASVEKPQQPPTTGGVPVSPLAGRPLPAQFLASLAASQHRPEAPPTDAEEDAPKGFTRCEMLIPDADVPLIEALVTRLCVRELQTKRHE